MKPCFGFLPRGPLAILKDSWCGEENLPVNFGRMQPHIYVSFMRNWRLPNLMLHRMLNVKKTVTQRSIISIVAISILMWASACWY